MLVLMLMLWMFTLFYASVCAYAYANAYAYALVKPTLSDTFLKKKMIKLFTLLQPEAVQKPLSSGVVETLIAYKKRVI